MGGRKAERSESNNFTINAELAQHSKTEDRRKEIDLNEPMLKIRKVAVMDPKRQNSEVQQLARQVNLKSESAAPQNLNASQKDLKQQSANQYMNLTFKGKLQQSQKHRKTGSLLDGQTKTFNNNLVALEVV